jgi:hypothetical protein
MIETAREGPGCSRERRIGLLAFITPVQLPRSPPDALSTRAAGEVFGNKEWLSGNLFVGPVPQAHLKLRTSVLPMV